MTYWMIIENPRSLRFIIIFMWLIRAVPPLPQKKKKRSTPFGIQSDYKTDESLYSVFACSQKNEVLLQSHTVSGKDGRILQ